VSSRSTLAGLDDMVTGLGRQSVDRNDHLRVEILLATVHICPCALSRSVHLEYAFLNKAVDQLAELPA
jgi:hypothetical protein